MRFKKSAQLGILLFSTVIMAGCGVIGPSYEVPHDNLQKLAVLQLQINQPTGSSWNPKTIFESGRIVSIDNVYLKPFSDTQRVPITPGPHTVGTDCKKGNQAPIWSGGVSLMGENKFHIDAKAGHTYILAIYPTNDQITPNSNKCWIAVKKVITER